MRKFEIKIVSLIFKKIWKHLASLSKEPFPRIDSGDLLGFWVERAEKIEFPWVSGFQPKFETRYIIFCWWFKCKNLFWVDERLRKKRSRQSFKTFILNMLHFFAVFESRNSDTNDERCPPHRRSLGAPYIINRSIKRVKSG